jgi:hypothetical protein
MRNVCVFRGFIPSEIISVLARYVRDCYARIEQQRIAGSLHPDFEVTRSWDGLAIPHLKKHLNGVGPITAVSDIIEAKIPGAKIVDDECSFRRHRNGVRHLGWHIDADAAGSFPFDPCFNMWLPLDPVGIDAPSLEVVKGSDATMRRLPLLTPPNTIRSDEWRRAHFPRHSIICPVLSPGDALLFSHYTLHRTQPMPNQRKERIGGEFRRALQFS